MTNDTTTLTLAAFLAARLAEDEELARDAALAVGDRGFGDERVERGQIWVSSYHKVCRRRLDDNPGKHVILEGRALGLSAAQHVARHDPARVLAEVAAKRAVLAAYDDERQRKDIYNRSHDERLLTTNGDRRSRLSSNARWAGLDVAVRYMVQVYSGHADFRPEWLPENW